MTDSTADGSASQKTGRRLALARWLTQPGHPLTARVIVNRVWKHHFGRGLVQTLDNFGVAGERPSHPELLDWLATEFVRNGWSIKWLHRTILTSETWQQTSRADGIESTNDASLLWHMPLGSPWGQVHCAAEAWQEAAVQLPRVMWRARRSSPQAQGLGGSERWGLERGSVGGWKMSEIWR